MSLGIYLLKSAFGQLLYLTSSGFNTRKKKC